MSRADDIISEGIEVRSMHVGGGQLWDGFGPVDGAEDTADGRVLSSEELSGLEVHTPED